MNVSDVIEQYDSLCMGHSPWIPSTPSMAKSRTVTIPPQDTTLLPMLLLNGPYPISIHLLYGYFYEKIVEAKVITFGQYMKQFTHPTCPPSTMTYHAGHRVWISRAHVLQGKVILPYGMSLLMARELLKQKDIHVECSSDDLYCTDPQLVSSLTTEIPCYEKTTITCMHPEKPHVVVTYASLEEYVDAWLVVKLRYVSMLREQDKIRLLRRKYERRLCQKIFNRNRVLNAKGEEIRYFVEEDKMEKRMRLEMDFGEEFVEHLWNLPIHNIDPSCLLQDPECDSEDEDGEMVEDEDGFLHPKKIRRDQSTTISARDLYAKELVAVKQHFNM
jgi:hypothetical protein